MACRSEGAGTLITRTLAYPRSFLAVVRKGGVPATIHFGDVLDSSAEALVLFLSPDSVSDLQDPRAEERLLGSVGQQFRRRWPEAWKLAFQNLRSEHLDLGEGEAVVVSVFGAPFNRLVLVATLSHRSDARPVDIARRAIGDGLGQAFSAGIRCVAMTPPTGASPLRATARNERGHAIGRVNERRSAERGGVWGSRLRFVL